MPTEEFYAGQANYIRKLNDLWDRATTSVFGTSTDSLSVTTGSKSFTTNTNLQFAAGSQVTITATADLSKYMSGQVTAYDQDTGAIVVNVTSVVGSGTFSSWSITLSGAAGATGAAGTADNLSIGTVTSGAAAASITGTSPNKFLNLTLQTGATGAAGAPNVLSIGTVTGGATASATITGTSPAQVLNLVLPKGDTGDTGATGATGLTARGAWNASTAYVTSPSVDWVTYAGSSYYRKVAGTTPTDPATDTTNWGVLALKGADGTGSVSSVTASAPLASTGGATPNITITQASGSTNGFLSSTDWNIFNGKQAALGYTPANKAGDTFTGNVSITYNGASPALKITQTGAGHSFVVEDESSDTTPFIIDQNGGVVIGGTPSGFDTLRISKPITGGTTSRAIVADGVVQSGVTNSAYYFSTLASTAPSSFTVSEIRHYQAMQGTIGAGSTVSAQYGFIVDASLVGASSNNFGFFGNIPSGAGRWNIFMNGTALNYMAGNLLVGSTTDTGEKLQVTGNAKVAGTITATNVVTNGYTAGYLEIPVAAQSANYTFTLADSGKAKLHPSADTTARTFTVPANASVAFPIGTAITVINQHGGGVITIAITTDVMRLAGAGTTGSRTLAANGIATLIKVTTTEWIISGVNLT